jgi:hypothetical protein
MKELICSGSQSKTVRTAIKMNRPELIATAPKVKKTRVFETAQALLELVVPFLETAMNATLHKLNNEISPAFCRSPPGCEYVTEKM